MGKLRQIPEKEIAEDQSWDGSKKHGSQPQAQPLHSERTRTPQYNWPQPEMAQRESTCNPEVHIVCLN